MLRYVLLPDGLAVNLGLKRHRYLEEDHLTEALIGKREEGAELVRPGIRAVDGSYQRLEITWARPHRHGRRRGATRTADSRSS